MFTNQWGSYAYIVYLEDWLISTRVYDFYPPGSTTFVLNRHIPCNSPVYYKRKHGEPHYYCKSCGTSMPQYMHETLAGIERACIQRLPYV